MNLKIFDTLIMQNRLDDFKECIKLSNLNAHHRSLLLEKCFISASDQFVAYMQTKASISPEKFTQLFITVLDKKLDKNILNRFVNVQDNQLCNKISNLDIQKLIVFQEKPIFDYFIDKFPLTMFHNFGTIVYISLSLKKDEYIKPFFNCQFDRNKIFYFCIAAYEYDRGEINQQFLKSQIKFNRDIILELKTHQKEIFDNYLLQKKIDEVRRAAFIAYMKAKDPKFIEPEPSKKIPKAEKLNEFMIEEFGKAFHDFLAESIPEKIDQKIKRTKI